MTSKEKRKQELIAKVRWEKKIKEYDTKRVKQKVLPTSVEKFFNEEF